MKVILPWSDILSEEVDSVDVVLKSGDVLTIKEDKITGVSVDLKGVIHTPMDNLFGREKAVEETCNCPWQNFEDCRNCTMREKSK